MSDSELKTDTASERHVPRMEKPSRPDFAWTNPCASLEQMLRLFTEFSSRNR